MNSLKPVAFFVLCLISWALGCGQDNPTAEVADAGDQAEIDASSDSCQRRYLQYGNLPDSYVASVWGSDPRDLFAVLYDGLHSGLWEVYHYDGVVWISMDLGASSEEIFSASIWGSAGDDVFLIGSYYYGGGFIKHYDGVSWTAFELGPLAEDKEFEAIWGTAGNDVFVAGSEGTILHYDGKAWSPMESGSNSSFVVVWGTSSNDVYAGGVSSSIYSTNIPERLFHYDGRRWSPVEFVGKDGPISISDVWDIWASSANDLYVRSWNEGETASAILHYDGQSWTRFNDGEAFSCESGSEVVDVWGMSEEDIYVLCDTSSEIVLSHFDGLKWSRTCSFTNYHAWTSFYFLYGTSEHDLYYFASTYPVVF